MPDANGYVDASCHVTVNVTAHPSIIAINGTYHARANPDGTYYPGDAFDFEILVWWTKNCWHIYPQPIRSGGVTLGSIQAGPVSSDGQGDEYYYEYGHAEIATTAGSAYVSQTVEAYGIVCGIFKCTKGYTYGSGSYFPQIIQPHVTVALRFENLTDRDGYEMRNGDGTYYTWDGINIVYDPNYKWKNERFGTIDAKTAPSSDIPLVGTYECHMKACPHTFSVPAILPWRFTFGYEEGHAAFNSTSRAGIGRHLFVFHTTVYNLGRRIGAGYNSTYALVVLYNPVYVNYPYTVLKDTSSWWGFGKSPAVALHYYGSTGGGPGDTPGIHPGRRSKVNGFAYDSFAYRITTPRPLNVTMTWQASYHASFSDGNFTYHDDSLQPGKNSAMFVHAGYGKIVFTDPILYPILRTRYDNSTIINQLQSSDFAGYGTYNLTRYTFAYPQTRFSTDVLVMALHSNGSINRIPLSLRMVPDFSENATYEQDFIREKVTHDRNWIFAGMVLGDMYGKGDSASGSGVVNMRANLTSMALPSVYSVLARDPLELPLNLVYEQPSPYNVTITAGQKRLSFIERGFEFDTSWKYVVNTDQDNPLNATRYQGLVTIHPDNYFGPYASILVDGRVENTACTGGCTILLPDRNANATVTAFNAWGGRASSTLAGGFSMPAVRFEYGGIVSSILVLVLAVIGYGLVKRYWGSLASMAGFGRN
ncbi:MAG: hypothetical protein KGI33_11585 [Thaumarchaeota archaeon]|nr:hypothetical protein [Nitrososphaerota archaeon]